jgi:undecaprenyl-diphosphatase
MTEFIKAVILGIVQGATEFLPISSSGHLIALKKVFGFEAPLAFDVCLHLATLGAVLIFFGREIVRLLRSVDRWGVGWRILLGTIPAGMIGIAVQADREDTGGWVVVGGWLVSALYLQLTANRDGEGTFSRISLGGSFLIGASQGIAAAVPGFSRSGISISSGLWLGLRRGEAFAFSFLLSIPVMLGAGLIEGRKLFKAGDVAIPGGWPALAGAMVAAFVVGLGAISILKKAVAGNGFHRFGYYNLLAAILFAIYLLSR